MGELTGKKPEYPAEDGLRNTAVLEAFYQSAESGRPVDLSL
jgi:predicted dehydrogenase